MGQTDTMLSDRETEVLEHLQRTLNTRDIAKAMDIRISTVHTYLQRIDAKQTKASATLAVLNDIEYDARRAQMTRDDREGDDDE
ncbi:DNA-binding response regulator [Halobellus sp. Atlit-31R]|nr:DNA-binding response regulator [Halobellus sp. Atlit-31R]